MTRRCAFLAALLGIAQLSLPAVAASLRAQLTQVERLLDQWRIDDAAKALATLVRSAPKHPLVLQLQGEVLFQRGEYKRAHELLREAVRHNRASLPLKGLRDLVGSTQEVVKGFVKHRSPSGEFEIWTARGKDEILVTFASETLERMRAALSQDLGYAPPGPIRVEILPSPDDLARVSPLSLADIDRSGTIALCKYNRLMIVTPRALLRGYGWRDALAHEYVHLAISRLSHNSVPIWLHEGLAKYLETRWRVPPGEAPPLSPAQEHLLAVALRKNRLVRWEQMHPSLAKLPSQEATMLAFAQVQTAVEFLVQRLRLAGFQQIIRSIRSGRSSWEAVRQATGMAGREFTARWRQHLRTRNLRQLTNLVPHRLRFGKRLTRERELANVKETRVRRYLRLADLLRTRGLTRAAIIEYEKARAILGPRNEVVANHLARAYLEAASPAQAISALLPVLEYYPELPGPQVTMGVAYLRNREPELAERHLKVALRINPFDPELHCNLAAALKDRADAQARLHASICNQLR